MTTKSQISLIALLILSNVCTVLPVYAVSKTRALPDGAYERVEREYVISNTRSVESLCDAGDTVVQRVCFGYNSRPDEGLALRTRDYPVVLETTEAQTGVACRPKVVHPEQVLTIESVVTCKKPATT